MAAEHNQLSILTTEPDESVTIKARDLSFCRMSPKAIRSFIASGHYSGKCPPSKFYFGALYNESIVGGMAFRCPSLPKVAAAYGADLELARLYMKDMAGKNSESRFIGWCLRYLRANTSTRRVISYADPHHGHRGMIYKAANFVYQGLEQGHGTRLVQVNGETMQAKTAYDRWGASGKNLECILGCNVRIVNMPKKHVWIKDLVSSADFPNLQ